MIRQPGTYKKVDMVSFAHVARWRLGMHPRYAARYVSGLRPDYPDVASDLKFGRRLRLEGDPKDPRSILIHMSDVETLVRRMTQLRGYFKLRGRSTQPSRPSGTTSIRLIWPCVISTILPWFLPM